MGPDPVVLPRWAYAPQKMVELWLEQQDAIQGTRVYERLRPPRSLVLSELRRLAPVAEAFLEDSAVPKDRKRALRSDMMRVAADHVFTLARTAGPNSVKYHETALLLQKMAWDSAESPGYSTGPDQQRANATFQELVAVLTDDGASSALEEPPIQQAGDIVVVLPAVRLSEGSDDDVRIGVRAIHIPMHLEGSALLEAVEGECQSLLDELTVTRSTLISSGRARERTFELARIDELASGLANLLRRADAPSSSAEEQREQIFSLTQGLERVRDASARKLLSSGVFSLRRSRFDASTRNTQFAEGVAESLPLVALANRTCHHGENGRSLSSDINMALIHLAEDLAKEALRDAIKKRDRDLTKRNVETLVSIFNFVQHERDSKQLDAKAYSQALTALREFSESKTPVPEDLVANSLEFISSRKTVSGSSEPFGFIFRNHRYNDLLPADGLDDVWKHISHGPFSIALRTPPPAMDLPESHEAAVALHESLLVTDDPRIDPYRQEWERLSSAIPKDPDKNLIAAEAQTYFDKISAGITGGVAKRRGMVNPPPPAPVRLVPQREIVAANLASEWAQKPWWPQGENPNEEETKKRIAGANSPHYKPFWHQIRIPAEKFDRSARGLIKQLITLSHEQCHALDAHAMAGPMQDSAPTVFSLLRSAGLSEDEIDSRFSADVSVSDIIHGDALTEGLAHLVGEEVGISTAIALELISDEQGRGFFTYKQSVAAAERDELAINPEGSEFTKYALNSLWISRARAVAESAGYPIPVMEVINIAMRKKDLHPRAEHQVDDWLLSVAAKAFPEIDLTEYEVTPGALRNADENVLAAMPAHLLPQVVLPKVKSLNKVDPAITQAGSTRTDMAVANTLPLPVSAKLRAASRQFHGSNFYIPGESLRKSPNRNH